MRDSIAEDAGELTHTIRELVETSRENSVRLDRISVTLSSGVATGFETSSVASNGGRTGDQFSARGAYASAGTRSPGDSDLSRGVLERYVALNDSRILRYACLLVEYELW